MTEITFKQLEDIYALYWKGAETPTPQKSKLRTVFNKNLYLDMFDVDKFQRKMNELKKNDGSVYKNTKGFLQVVNRIQQFANVKQLLQMAKSLQLDKKFMLSKSVSNEVKFSPRQERTLH